MARIFAYADSPTAPTGFGRSSAHALGALHRAGHEIVQLAVNHQPGTEAGVPWRIVQPMNRGGDPYGLDTLGAALLSQRFDMLWTTFDPEVPWRYQVAGAQPPVDVLRFFAHLKLRNPGFKMVGYFPVDGGPLSDFELAVLGGAYFDAVVTPSPHVHDLVEWTLKLKGEQADRAKIEEQVRVIPHAVDLARYQLQADRRAAKARLGLNPDAFVIVQVERNQQRKEVWLALELMERLFARRPELRGKVQLWQHMLPDEESQGSRVGWNLPDLAWRYGLQVGRDVFFPPGFVSEADLVQNVYGAADVCLSVSTGEGFQYPLFEALACGVRVLAPADSARAAWLTHAPGAHLYRSQERSNVMRGGYNRRMNRADTGDALRVLLKMLDGAPKFAATPDASRAWVERRFALPPIEQAWVDLVAEQEQKLAAERRASGVYVPADPCAAIVNLRGERLCGLGDLVTMAPALRALRSAVGSQGGKLVAVIDRHHLELSRLLGLADAFHVEPGAPAEEAPYAEVAQLWQGQGSAEWNDPTAHRAFTVAEALRVPAEALSRFGFDVPAPWVEAARRLTGNVGADLRNGIVIAGQSGSLHRAIPDAYLDAVADGVRARGFVPILVGDRAPRGPARYGVLDLRGHTELPALLGLLAGAAAVIATDSGPLHLAAAVRAPLVAVFPTVDPRARLGFYLGKIEALAPAGSTVAGEAFPPADPPKAAPGEWAALVKPESILFALDSLLGRQPTELRLIRGDA